MQSSVDFVKRIRQNEKFLIFVRESRMAQVLVNRKIKVISNPEKYFRIIENMKTKGKHEKSVMANNVSGYKLCCDKKYEKFWICKDDTTKRFSHLTEKAREYLRIYGTDTLLQIQEKGDPEGIMIPFDRKMSRVEVITEQQAEMIEKEKGENRQRLPNGTVRRVVKYTSQTMKKNNNLIVWGYPQLGKTSLIIGLAECNIYNGRSTIIVLMPLETQKIQFAGRYLDDLKMKGLKTIFFDTKTDEMEVADALSGRAEPCVYIALGNSAQIRRLNRIISSEEKIKYDLICDECDTIGTDYTKSGDTLFHLENNAIRNIKVSATTLTSCGNEIANGDMIVHMPKTKEYICITTINRHSFEVFDKKNILEKIPFIKEYIDESDDRKPVYIERYDTYVPNISLMNVHKQNNNQEEIFHYGIDETEKTAFILFNGKGIQFSHPDITKKPVKFNDIYGRVRRSEVKFRNGTPIHSIKDGLVISDIIQWFKDNGGVEKFPNLIIISGNLASRGISFVSKDYGKYLQDAKNNVENPTIGWRTQNLIYHPGNDTCQPNIIQESARICGIAPLWGDRTATLYATENTIRCVIQSYKIQEEVMTNLMKNQEEMISASMGKLTLHTDKWAKKEGCKACRDLTLKKTEESPKRTQDITEDNGLPLDEYEYQDTILESKSNGTYGTIQRKKEEKFVQNTEDKMNRIKDIYENRKDQIVAKIIEAFVQNRYESLTVDQISDFVGNPINITNYDRWGSHNKYKILTKSSRGRYILTDQVVEVCELE